MSTTGHVDPTNLEAVRAAVGLDEPGSVLHPVGLDEIVIGPDALEELERIVAARRGPGAVVMVVDRQSMRRGTADLKALVADRLRVVDRDMRIVRADADADADADEGELHADAAAIDRVVAGSVGAGCLVAVGSGTICDIAKEASRRLDVPYVVAQTANSVNAFSDDMAVLLINGVKRTVPSRWPDALVVDLTVVAYAPAALNRAGVGELTSMFTAPADWRLAAAAGMDGSWDRRVVDLFRGGATAFIAAAPYAASRDMAAQRTLVELMTLSGLALGIAGRTSPISGTEHTVSHLLDMAAARSGRATGLHGAQVGVAALAVSVAWRTVLDGFDPERFLRTAPLPAAVMRQRIDDAFGDLDPTGRVARECWSEYRLKLDRWEATRPDLRALANRWPEIERELRGLLGDPAEIAGALRSAGAAATFDELDPPVSRDQAAWALFNGHLIRERFTLADLAWFTGRWSEDVAGRAIDEAAAVAGQTAVQSGSRA